MAAPADVGRVAVVMCTYNGERFLDAQLRSILDQERRPDEVLVVDDLSTDGTWQVLVGWASRMEAEGVAVHLHCNERNLGYVRNFERALHLCQADVLFLADQDDVWMPAKVKRMTEVLARRPDLDLLHTDARLVDAEGRDLGHTLFGALELSPDELGGLHAGQAFRVLLRRNVVTGMTIALRRRCIEWAGRFPDNWVHDEWLAINVAIRGRLDCLEEQLVEYRQHGGNQIGIPIRTSAARPVYAGTRRGLMRAIESRLIVLRQRLAEQMPLSPLLAEVDDRLLHARLRAHLPASWTRRTTRVFSEYARGRYSAYSFGLRSAVADLLALP